MIKKSSAHYTVLKLAIFLASFFIAGCAHKKVKRDTRKSDLFGAEDPKNFDSINLARYSDNVPLDEEDDAIHSLPKEKEIHQRVDALALVRQQEAKCVDVPIPLQTEPAFEYMQNTQDNASLCLAYKTAMSLEELYAFYRAQMELQGWRTIGCFQGKETLLICEKPTKICSISMRPFAKRYDPINQTLLLILLCQKETENKKEQA